jgi:hypothetical protein
MFMAIRKYKNIQGDKKQMVDTINRGFVPLISKIDGFVDYYCCFTDDTTLLSVSVYRDAKGADDSVRTAAKWVEENLAKHLPEKPEVLSGDVFAHREAQRQKAA